KFGGSSHPTALLLGPEDRLLYVALANRDRVALIEAANGQVQQYLPTGIPSTAVGSFPNALAQSSDGTKVYVASASANAVAVFDFRRRESYGSPRYFIPTEWYPTALA